VCHVEALPRNQAEAALASRTGASGYPFIICEALLLLKDVAPGESHHHDYHHSQKRHLSCGSLQEAEITLCRHGRSPSLGSGPGRSSAASVPFGQDRPERGAIRRPRLASISQLASRGIDVAQAPAIYGNCNKYPRRAAG
jgi:hypothetical protein